MKIRVAIITQLTRIATLIVVSDVRSSCQCYIEIG
jgi:hypothetical protein